jgi:secreted trypsin-like serine protease
VPGERWHGLTIAFARGMKWSCSFLLILLAACTGMASEDAATVASPIVNGAVDGQDAAAVMVFVQHAKNPTPETSFTCTGTVVSPHVLLTAAHCLDPRTVGDGQTVYVFTAWDTLRAPA